MWSERGEKLLGCYATDPQPSFCWQQLFEERLSESTSFGHTSLLSGCNDRDPTKPQTWWACILCVTPLRKRMKPEVVTTAVLPSRHKPAQCCSCPIPSSDLPLLLYPPYDNRPRNSRLNTKRAIILITGSTSLFCPRLLSYIVSEGNPTTTTSVL